MPHARHAAGRHASGTRHVSRHRKRRIGPLPGALGVVTLVGATVAAFPGGSSPEGTAAASLDADTSELRGLEDLREQAADDASRGSERDSERDAGGSERDRAQRGNGDESADAPAGPEQPSQPTATIVPPEAEEPAGADDLDSGLPGGFPPVPGCDASVPPEGSVANGELGSEHLCDVGEGFLLRPDAGAAFLALAEDYREDADGSLVSCIGNSYRTYDQQVDLYARKPSLAAEPGTSEHGWGLAIDFECGANSYGSSFYGWLTENGAEYGWTNPDWAQPTGSRPEPWHWEFDPSLLD